MTKLSRRKLTQYAANRIAAGESNEVVMRDTAAYLIDTHRKSEVMLIIRDIEAMLLEKGVAIGTITSARPLSQSSLDTIESYVKHQVSGVKQVVLREQVDEELIGGMRLELPGQQLDASVKANLDKITA